MQNYAEGYGLSFGSLKREALMLNPKYFAISEEVTEIGTMRYYLYIETISPVSYSRIRKAFPLAYIEEAPAPGWEIRRFLIKEGIWAYSGDIPEYYDEFGEIPLHPLDRM